jgi:peptide deformylase
MSTENLEIKFIGDEVLGKKSSKIEKITDEIKELSKNMIELMYEKNGIGLAASQVGINSNLIVIDIKEMESESLKTPGEVLLIPQMPIVLINPELTAFSQETSIAEEGCLSVPELYAQVERPDAVHLRAELLSGEKLNIHCGGFLARVLQHEIDHLNGTLFVDRLSEDVAKRINSKLKKLQKKLLKKK